MIDSTSDQKDIPWLYFISSTSLVMSITALLFRWREEPMIKYIECTEMAITEFLLFVLTATLGGMFLCGANDLITIFVAPECFSLCSYLLSGYTKKDVRSNEATMKYLLMGGDSISLLHVHGVLKNPNISEIDRELFSFPFHPSSNQEDLNLPVRGGSVSEQ
ncbi:hypothetical protein Pfo_029483 [Paulownia fortunei]|nr:hypothetical protein Pfo_029483 [Paulownia fortunei]